MIRQRFKALRYAAQQYLRTRGPFRELQPQQYNNRQPAQARVPPPPVVQQQQGPQQGHPPAPFAQPNAPQPFGQQPIPSRPAPNFDRPCFICQQVGHFARECPNRDQAQARPVAQPSPVVNQMENPVLRSKRIAHQPAPVREGTPF